MQHDISGGSMDLRDQVRHTLRLVTRSNGRWIARASAVSASLLLATTSANPVRGQAPYRIDKVPGTSFDLGSLVGPAWADIDADGDGDLVVSAGDGPLKLLRNVGNATGAVFELELEGAHQNVQSGGFGSPALADLDGDGDLDLVVDEDLRYFENIGDDHSPEWVEATANPFAGVSAGGYLSFADLDGDGDLDSLLGDKFEEIRFMENVGSTSNPAFVDWTIEPFPNTVTGYGVFGDLDNDGDYDLVVAWAGTYAEWQYWENTGGSVAPAFESPALDPFSGTAIDKYGSPPSLADLDGDGDLDLVHGGEFGILKMLENTGTSSQPSFIQSAAGPLGGIEVNRIQVAGDLDDDGDLDLVNHHFSGSVVSLIENTGSAAHPGFLRTTASLFSGQNPNGSVIVFSDLDADGDLDVVGVNSYDYLGLFENTGSASQPEFEESFFNPFHGLETRPAALGDLDADGDRDLVLRDSGSLIFFENTGDASVAGYLEATANPFAGIEVEGTVSPVLVDVDRDGDLDAVLSDPAGTIVFLRNAGTPQSPAFVEAGPTLFEGVEGPVTFGFNASSGMVITDIDGDLDLDAIIANFSRLVLFRSDAAVFDDGFESGSTGGWSSASPSP
ncbi:MAG: VCBS repeat-containing protein [Thermoanaerobaculia bacterium]|nr:VCBS repeat-containing protein [Thermoanaerobaculia bacterium]